MSLSASKRLQLLEVQRHHHRRSLLATLEDAREKIPQPVDLNLSKNYRVHPIRRNIILHPLSSYMRLLPFGIENQQHRIRQYIEGPIERVQKSRHLLFEILIDIPLCEGSQLWALLLHSFLKLFVEFLLYQLGEFTNDKSLLLTLIFVIVNRNLDGDFRIFLFQQSLNLF